MMIAKLLYQLARKAIGKRGFVKAMARTLVVQFERYKLSAECSPFSYVTWKGFVKISH